MSLLPFISALGFFFLSIALREARGKSYMIVLPFICFLVFLFYAIAGYDKVYADLLFAILALGITIKNLSAFDLWQGILRR